MVRTETPWGPWDHYPLEDVALLLDGIGIEWWVAGGYAIDAFTGTTRPHEDIDIGLWRDDQAALHRHFPGWHFIVGNDPAGTIRDWPAGETLAAHIHDIWTHPTRDEPWRVQFMLEERTADTWHYRRDPSLTRPVDTITWQHNGVRYLAPEIQLLYKALGSLRPKDHLDFDRTLPHLSQDQRAWLTSNLPPSHPWH